MSARLSLSPEGGGAFTPGDLPTLLQLLERTHKLLAVDETALQAWVEAGDLERPVLIAQGKPAVQGEDGSIEFLYQQKASARKQEQQEASQVDYKEWGMIDTVVPDEVLARVQPPGAGTPGVTVYGEDIPAQPGRAVKLTAGKNVVLEEQDGATVAKSTIEGMVSLLGNKIEVSPVYIVNGDVEMTVGNVHFNGDVIVRGDVREGFTVEATGDIEVQKNIDKGGLEAGGNVIVRGTIFGKEEVWIRAGGSIEATGAENANLEAEGDVVITKNVIQSHIIAACAFLGHDTGGVVRGGTIQTTGDIALGTVGSSGLSSMAHVEIKWPKKLIQQMVKFKEERDRLGNDRGEVERQLLHLRRTVERGHSLTAAQAKRIKELEQAAHQFRERETELQFEREALGEQIEERRHGAITIYGEVHPDAVLVIHGKSMAIHEPRGAMRIEAAKDRLRTSAPRPVTEKRG